MPKGKMTRPNQALFHFILTLVLTSTDDKIFTIVLCTGETHLMQCDTGETLEILEVEYGRQSPYECWEEGKVFNHKTIDCQAGIRSGH